MAGWSPPLDPSEIDLVCHRGPDAERLGIFLVALTADAAGQRVRDRWVATLLMPRTDSANGSAA